jgi:uncharacterized protein YndB with AHSA1/START domain
MTPATPDRNDPALDLVLERVVDVPRTLVWQAWTRAEHVKKWFAPAPWTIAECEIDLRPGGVFRTVMRSPEGESFPGAGCILDVVENERLVWTDALGPGWRPAESPFMTVVVTFEDRGAGTRYTARAMHRSPDDRKKHEEMGFVDGFGKCFDQLLALVRTL